MPALLTRTSGRCLLNDRRYALTKAEATECDVVILATRWVNVPEALKYINWHGRILIDATNAHLVPNPDISRACFRPTTAHGITTPAGATLLRCRWVSVLAVFRILGITH
jgi:hypothetical protein